MTNHGYLLSKAEFDAIYAKVPRLTVEILLANANHELYLTMRAIEPCMGQWHLPGGTVRFGESLVDAVRRIANKETGITVHAAKLRGYIEYPSHYLNGMDSPVGIAFEVTSFTGELHVDAEASAGHWFSTIPDPMHADQDKWLVEHGYLTY